MLYLLAGLSFTGITVLYIVYFLPKRKFPSRFRAITEKRMHFFLYIHGKWNREILLPWKEVRMGIDPDSDFSFAVLEELLATSFRDLPSHVVLSPTDEYLRVTADRPLLIQGVERSSGWLRVNGILRSGPVKLVFKGPLEVRERVPVKPSLKAWVNYYGPGAVSASLALLFIGMGLYSFGSSKANNAFSPTPIVSTPASPTSNPEQIPLPSSPGIDQSVSTNGLASIAQRPSMKPEPQKEPLPDFPDSLSIVEPGGKIPNTSIKVLFVHAHPDDESIEFGTLMALCKRQGIPTATVLFTDGEGGIFSKEYSGPRTSLREIRIREAAWALKTLGSSVYIRLGLSNLPYNGIRDEQKPIEVLQRWSSSKPIDRMVEILLTLKPDIVVSPEEPSKARKHFEHEATALIVWKAIEQVKRLGNSFPRGYLQSLDPRFPMDRKGKLSFPRSQAKDLQRTALSFHRTQADAFYFGVQRIEKYPEEEYKLKFWDLLEDPLLYFMGRAVQ
ncbi:MAG: PIG-L family deacetylase [Spirochaetes bacterium]|nr:PIG-L family deacetylase [Spirochaetota bacterium]